MAIKNGGDNVGGEPADNASAQPPAEPPRYENAPSPNADDNSKQNAATAKELQKIEAGERWLIGIGVATILINAIIAYIYYGQLQQMRIATEASTKAATLAADALDQNSGQFDRTVRQLIYQTANQAEAVKAAKDANGATQRVLQAHFIMGLMPASERGHIVVTLRNIGKTSSGDVIARGEMRIESLTNGTWRSPQIKSKNLGDVQPEGSPYREFEFDIPASKPVNDYGSPESIMPSTLQNSAVHLRVWISYDAGFGKVVKQSFCRVMVGDDSVNPQVNIVNVTQPECGDARIT